MRCGLPLLERRIVDFEDGEAAERYAHSQGVGIEAGAEDDVLAQPTPGRIEAVFGEAAAQDARRRAGRRHSLPEPDDLRLVHAREREGELVAEDLRLVSPQRVPRTEGGGRERRAVNAGQRLRAQRVVRRIGARAMSRTVFPPLGGTTIGVSTTE